MSFDLWEEAEDEFLDGRTLEELLGGGVVSTDESEIADLSSSPTSVDDAKVEAALRDLGADTRRTGAPIGVTELHQTAARHRLTVSELALVELEAEAEVGLPSILHIGAD